MLCKFVEKRASYILGMQSTLCVHLCDHTILETLVLCASLHIQAFKNAVLLHTPEVKCLKSRHPTEQCR